MKNSMSIQKVILMIIGFWLVAGLLLFGVYKINNDRLPTPIPSNQQSKVVIKKEVPKTSPVFLNQTKLLSESDTCSPSSTSRSYSSMDGKYGYLINVIDTKAPFKDGYDRTNIDYVNSFIDKQVTIQSEKNNVNRAFFLDCGGYLSRQVGEITDERYQLKNVESVHSVFTIDSQQQGGSLFYYSVSKRGDFLVYLRVGATGLESNEESYKACTTGEVLDQKCYDTKVITDVNKKTLLDEVEKALELMSFN
jgi:hypothetical protein